MENKIIYDNISSDVLPSISSRRSESRHTREKTHHKKSRQFKQEIISNNEQYMQKLNDLMKDYKYEVIDPHSYIREYSSITKKPLTRNISSGKALHNSVDDPLIKIDIKEEEFSNPALSKLAIDKNKNIYETIMKTINSRSLILQGQFLKEHVDLTNINDILKNVKVSQLISRRSLLQDFKNRDKNSKNRKDGQNVNLPNLFKPRLMYDRETLTCKMLGRYIYYGKNFPEGRDQFSLTIEGSDIVLFGGIVTNQSNHIWRLDANKLEWNKIIPANSPANQRYGHSGILYQRKLYIFGGRTKLDNFVLYGDLDVFNLDTRMWETPIVFTKPSTKRRNHVAKLVGNHILFHGGINENSEYLNDCCLLSLNPLKWVNINLESKEFPSLAYHDACLVLPYDQMYNHKLSIYKLPEQNIGKKTNSKIKEKGLYLFGGKSSDEGNLKNDVWILKIGQKPLEWTKIITNGMPPSPRQGHTLNFYEDGNFLIVHGGRNDSLSNEFALNDTYLLELSTFNWIKVDLKIESISEDVYKRYGHCSLVICK